VQLNATSRNNSRRRRFKSRLHKAAAALLTTAAATTTAFAAGPKGWDIGVSNLYYGEQSRTTIDEPMLYFKHELSNNQVLSGYFVLDAMTGASANGATPTNKVQTFTGASGQSRRFEESNGEEGHGPTIIAPGAIPLLPFHDHRAAADLDWEVPLQRLLKGTFGGHLSSESDYTSTGLTATFALDTPNRLTTLTLGGGINGDNVNPIGGRPQPFASITATRPFGSASKVTTDGLIGLTRVLTRHAMMQVNYSRSREHGYLTEPYKVVSLLSLPSGETSDYLNENRPGTRNRQSVFTEAVAQILGEVTHLSYRYYWDDWGIRSNTYEARLRLGLGHGQYLEPHFRYYQQSKADFFVSGLQSGAAFPTFASSDYRLGNLIDRTIGIKYGITIQDNNEISVRVEYMRQSPELHPADAIGVQRLYNLFPPVNITIVQVGYSFEL
jgi:hypothetical protein